MKRVAGLVLVTAALAAAVAYDLNKSATPAPGEKVALDFSLKDVDGHDVNFADFKGKPLIVNFWATWCGPCKIETPYLEEFSKKYKAQGLTIVGIETETDAASIRKFANEYQVSYPLVIGFEKRDIQNAFGWEGTLPTSVLLRADGTVSARIVGLRSEEYWEKRIKALF